MQVALAGLDVLQNDASPLGVRNAISDLLDCLLGVEVLNAKVLADFDVLSQFLVSLIVLVVERASVKADDPSKSIIVVDGSGSCNLSTESVTTDSCHGNLVLVHKPHDIIRCVLCTRNYINILFTSITMEAI